MGIGIIDSKTELLRIRICLLVCRLFCDMLLFSVLSLFIKIMGFLELSIDM